jgi:CspA family cold shock protein
MQWVSLTVLCRVTPQSYFFQESAMAEGKIKRLTEKGFGFIETGTDKDMFFHTSSVEGVRFEDLREGQRVSYTPGHGPKGPRAENVRVI